MRKRLEVKRHSYESKVRRNLDRVGHQWDLPLSYKEGTQNVAPGRGQNKIPTAVCVQTAWCCWVVDPPLSDKASSCPSLGCRGFCCSLWFLCSFLISIRIQILYTWEIQIHHRDGMQKGHSKRKLGSHPNAKLAIQFTGKWEHFKENRPFIMSLS